MKFVDNYDIKMRWIDRLDSTRVERLNRREHVVEYCGSITAMLDMAYLKADNYLVKLAEKSGGRLLRADTLRSLPDAFSQIAAELRTQYLIGYYPIKKEQDERYRRIKVSSARKNVVIRARPGYIATATR